MRFRQATIKDLPQLKTMYGKIIDHMKHNDIDIWDDIYPCEFFRKDIENNCLYLLIENDSIIVSALALCETNAGESHVTWEKLDAKAFYIDRFAVNVNYGRRGLGAVMLEHAKTRSKEMGAEYLRLFVVEINQPAIELYLKSGFRQVAGIFEERIDEDLVLREYGFEIEIK